MINKLTSFIRKPSCYVILLALVVVPVLNSSHHKWLNDEGVIEWDVKSYYAYLPAAFIYGDLSLSYMDEDPGKWGKWIWPVETPTGKKAIVTSMGNSFMYFPFFMVAHGVAKIFPAYEADGYSLPYHLALAFAAYFYFILGLFILRWILLRYFPDWVTALTLLAIGVGTNLLFYVTYSAPMTHAFSFVLIVTFLYFVIRWQEKINWKNTVILGLLAGLIALVRPTNIIVLLLVPLFGADSGKKLQTNIKMILNNWYYILLMAFCFVLVWVPQFAYWKYVSGKIFYFSYGEAGGRFFFGNPQVLKLLFSYGKGWFVYTPMMILSVIGIIVSFRKKKSFAWAISVYLVLNIYILSSWWCWWFGGAFGQRSMVDAYGLLALPLAAFISELSELKWHRKFLVVSVVLLLTGYNVFQMEQYNKGAIHYWLNSKEGYWTNFLKTTPTQKYWHTVLLPDYDKAHDGIYEVIPADHPNNKVTDEMLVGEVKKDLLEQQLMNESISFEISDSIRVDSLLTLKASEIVANKQAEKYYRLLKTNYFKRTIKGNTDWRKEVERKARRKNISFEEMLDVESVRLYQNYTKKYAAR